MFTLFKKVEKKPTLAIREANIKDAKGIVKLIDSVGKEKLYMVTENYTLTEEEERQLIRKLNHEKDLILVADYGGNIIGCLTLFRYYGGRSPKVQHVGEIGISIDSEFRNNGIGSKLFEYTIEWAKRKNYKKLCLSVFSSNLNAIHLYEKYGFQIEGRRKQQFKIGDNYVDEILMGLFL
ncbi:GNAT family N-acetyltransferase [Thermoanaerobacterium sp. RBIITD]|uniref:GNAT family N-acetyltransferase n=1 Tax=Thermoanaerobacterium sp. RBIITD TaxID=1550240 RepID=UPI000BB957EC|nr:GNAT family N-acetyltransferase [Thermoanaerobacterium sp. RBIITD]SNX55073.1 Protein N-acetyltransferase, RimJ/RimL family [Thermoanaerobacterium sp. RBIITD]